MANDVFSSSPEDARFLRATRTTVLLNLYEVLPLQIVCSGYIIYVKVTCILN